MGLIDLAPPYILDDSSCVAVSSTALHIPTSCLSSVCLLETSVLPIIIRTEHRLHKTYVHANPDDLRENQHYDIRLYEEKCETKRGGENRMDLRV
jgi:hypothetical protein